MLHRASNIRGPIAEHRRGVTNQCQTHNKSFAIFLVAKQEGFNVSEIVDKKRDLVDGIVQVYTRTY